MRKIADDKVRHIQKLAGKALPQKEIAQIVGVSVGLVNKVLKGAPPAPSPPPSTEDLNEVPDEIPEGTALEVVDRWIPKIERAIEAAEAGKDYSAMSSLMAKLVAILEHKRKATPIAAPDPNDNPDMIAAAKRVRDRWFKLLDGLAGK